MSPSRVEHGRDSLRSRRIGRLGAGLSFALVVAGLTAGGASSFDGAPGAAAPVAHRGEGLQLQVMTSTDSAALSAGSVRVQADSPGNQRVELSTAGFGNGPLLTVPTTVGLKPGANSLDLPLSGKGREVLAGCGATQLIVTAFDSSSGATLARGMVSLNRTVPQCAKLDKASRCETIAAPGTNCLFPWPSNHFTVTDPSTGTGRQVNLKRVSMPENKNGVPVDPTELNRSDGFSPGVSIVTHVPGLTSRKALNRTQAVRVTDMNKAFKPDQPIVLIDATTGQRQLIWAEVDSNATSPQGTDLIIRVGKNLKEGHRYIVGMRDLRTAGGQKIPAPPGFALYRDDLKTNIPAIEQRRQHFDSIFKTLKDAGIQRGNLYDAWDFTVASTQNITGRMLHIRDNGLAQLGDNTPGDGIEQGHAPDFTITDVKTVDEPSPGPGHEDLAVTDPSHAVQNVREVTGTFQVPCYLNQVGCPSGSRFNLGADGLPHQTPGNFYTANFTCNIPQSAVHEQTPGAGDWQVVHPDRTSMYGHGLFGDAGEVHTTNVRQLGDDHNVITCATDFIGMAEEDVIPEAVPALRDLSNFPPLPDRLQQGLLDFIYLGRLMSLPDGFAGDPAFKFGGQSAIDTSKGVFYYGNSQGGIAGGALTAVEPDVTRSVLYVPGMNYSTLLTRSVDFSDYALILLSLLSQRERPAAAPVADPDGMGPRRAGRLRQPHDQQPAAGDAGAPRPDRHVLGRPSGHQRRHGGGGAHERRAAAAPRARSRPAAERVHQLLPAAAHAGATLGPGGPRQRVLRLGHRPQAPGRGGRLPRHGLGADHQHRAQRLLRRRPARHGDQHLARGPPPDRGVHQSAGQDHRPLRQRPLLRGGLDRPAVGHARPRGPASSR